MKTATLTTVWSLGLFYVFLWTSVLYGNNVCPKAYTGTWPVVHMCTDESVTEVDGFFLDAFAPVSTATTCNCTLHATTYVQITVSATVAPDYPCDSHIYINTERVFRFECGYGNTTLSSNLGTGDVYIQLKTVVSEYNDATYCIDIVKSLGTGTLSLKCFSPYGITTPATTTTKTTSTTDNNVCRISSTGTLPVVHMCTDESVTEVEQLFLDAFAPASTASTCNCTLHATSYIQITTSLTFAPDAPCDSHIYINTDGVLKFECGYGTETLSRNIGPGDVSIQLKTVVPTNKDATYCIIIVKSHGTGTLSLTCFSPYGITTPATTTTQTTSTPATTTTPTTLTQATSTTPTTSTTETTTLSTTVTSTQIKTSPKTSSATSTSDTSQTKTSTSVITNTPEQQKISDTKSFPVAAAVAIGVIGGMLIETVIVGIIILYRRMRKRKQGRTNTTNTGEYMNGDVNLSNMDDTADNNYDQLQHTDQTPAADQEHVYLHINGETVHEEPNISEHDAYVSVERLTL